MKRINGSFLALVTFLGVAIIATLASRVLSWKDQNSPARPTTSGNYQRPINQEKENLSPTQIMEGSGVTGNFGSSDTWPYFNRGYNEIPKRNFRLRYPSLLTIDNLDSGPVALEKNNEFYLTVEEDFPLTKFSIGDTPDERFKAYYSLYKRNDHPDFVFERIDFSKNAFLYKVSDNEDYYLGEINGHGIEIIDYKKLPKEVVDRVIRSIEFR